MDEAWYDRMLPLFLSEADACLCTMEQSVSILSVDSADPLARVALARAAHTIKGNAAALGLRQMTQEAQRIEIWAMLPATTLTDAMLEGLEIACRTIRVMLQEIGADIPLGSA